MVSASGVGRDGDTFTAGCQLGSALIGDWLVESAEELDDVSVRVGEVNLLDVCQRGLGPPTGAAPLPAKMSR